MKKDKKVKKGPTDGLTNGLANGPTKLLLCIRLLKQTYDV